MTSQELTAIYLATATAIFIEGETALIASSFAAKIGYLNFPLVFFIAYFSTISYDWVWFFIGRWRGRKYIESRKGLQKMKIKVDNFLNKRQTLFLLIYRFLYGFRGAICLIVGLSQVKAKKFISLSLITTLIWTAIYSGLGFFFGKVLEKKLSNFQSSAPFFLLGIACLGIILYSITTYSTGKKFFKSKE
ncbi:MAG TPA: DedA family protein [Bacteroidia bacterium]|nr:DedA family protein [Bacteroidia bacterium]HRS58747.1 DedA family protein [Bacteroidia bacterium]HRU67919.1 DedA family protein [Bacteroidia bacterium]